MKKILCLILVLAMALTFTVKVAKADGETTITDIGWIKTSTDEGKTWVFADEFNDDNGHRIWTTSAKTIFPDSKWDTRFTAAQIKTYENQWIDVKAHVPEGAMCRVFCKAWQQGGEVHQGGYVMTLLLSGDYTFKMLNGEAINWESGSDSAEADLSTRIWPQIRDGNINTPHELDFSLATADLIEKVPSYLADYIGVTAGPIADK